MTDREEYIEKTKARLDQWNAEIEKASAKMKEAEADAKIEYQRQLDEMCARRDEAEEKVKALQNASQDAWSDMKSGFDKVWQDMSKSFENAAARFS